MWQPTNAPRPTYLISNIVKPRSRLGTGIPFYSNNEKVTGFIYDAEYCTRLFYIPLVIVGTCIVKKDNLVPT